MEAILIGVTDRTIPVFISDPASTTGAGKTGLAAAAITVTYTRYETDNDVVTTDVTSSVNDLTALTDAHNDWGWKEVSSTLSKGQYRLDIADAVFASGAWYAVVQVTITSGTAAATPKEFLLVAYDPLNAVRLGLTALPNAAADAAGGLPISDAGGLDLDAKIGALTYGTANRVNAQVYGMEAGTVTAAAVATGAIDADAIAADAITDAKVASDVTIASVTGAVGSVTGAVGSVTGAVGSIASGGITAASFGANAITAAKLDPDVTTELQAGLATAAALAVVDGIVDDILLDTAEIGTAGAGLSNINLPNQTMDIVGNITGNLSGSVGSVTGAVGSVAGAVGSVTGNVGGNVTGSVGSVATGGIAAASFAAGAIDAAAIAADAIGSSELAATAATEIATAVTTAISTGTALTAIPWNASWDAEVQSEVQDALDATIADSIPADGTRPSISQALYMLTQFMLERAVSSTTVTVRKVDGSTSLFTLTLDSATAPTSITRAT